MDVDGQTQPGKADPFRNTPIRRGVAATLSAAPYISLPLVLILLSALLAAGAAYLPWMIAIVLLLGYLADTLGLNADAEPPADNPHWLRELPIYTTIPLVLLATIFFLHAISDAAPGELTPFRLVCGIIAMGMLYGTAAAIVGHDLIHRIGSPRDVALGQLMMAFVLDPTDAVEHVYGHHRNAATPADSTTARRNEGFWSFLPRAVTGAAASAWAIETRRQARRGRTRWTWRNLVLHGVLIQAVIIVLAFLLGGTAGGLAFLAAALVARLLGEVTKYISHYGLVRVPGQPIEQRHSWNASGAVSAQMMLRAAWHSDHHVHPDRPYWSLNLHDDAPRIPLPAGIVMLVAIVPPLWRRVMHPRLAAWDAKFATPAELSILRG